MNLFARFQQRRREAKLKNTAFDAASDGDTATLLSLLAAGFDINAEDNGMTALTAAASSGQVEIVRTLIQRGASVEGFTTARVRSPLMEAAVEGQAECVQLLIEAGANADTKDPEHEVTALMLAAQSGSAACVQVLLHAGADIKPEDWEGRTALDYATSGDVASLLRGAGAVGGLGEPPKG